MIEDKLKYPPIRNVSSLVHRMTTPSLEVVDTISKIGDKLLILGVGGKMGPTLAELVVNAGGQVIGVDIFPDEKIQGYLDKIGVKTIKCDLFNNQQLASLPDASYVILMVGTKFGTSGNAPLTWAMNTYLPGKLLEKFFKAKIIYISSGNVYKFIELRGKGASEQDELEPIGEYAMSRLGGERLVQYISQSNHTPTCIIRLFYATELRYGIIHDIAVKIKNREPIDLSMGSFNQVWQGDANAFILQSFRLCDAPAKIFNLTGPDILSVRSIATKLGELMDIEPQFKGTENATALLGDATEIFKHLGQPKVTMDQVIEWVAWWVLNEGESLGKPTKFEKRDGKF